MSELSRELFEIGKKMKTVRRFLLGLLGGDVDRNPLAGSIPFEFAVGAIRNNCRNQSRVPSVFYAEKS